VKILITENMAVVQWPNSLCFSETSIGINWSFTV